MENVLQLQKRNVGSRSELSERNEEQNPGEVPHKRGIITLTLIDVCITSEKLLNQCISSFVKNNYMNKFWCPVDSKRQCVNRNSAFDVLQCHFG